MNNTLKTNAVRTAIASHTELDDNPSASKPANMNTLIASGITAAWWYSAVAVLFPQLFPEQALAEALLDVATVVVALVVLVIALEVKTKGRASEAIKKRREI